MYVRLEVVTNKVFDAMCNLSLLSVGKVFVYFIKNEMLIGYTVVKFYFYIMIMRIRIYNMALGLTEVILLG